VAEAKLQAKILKYLESLGFVVIKIVVANKAGHADIVCCAPNGKFFAIEVKDDDVPRELQEYKLNLYLKNNGVAFWCDSYEMFEKEFNKVKRSLGLK
jgi:Holliday junction resolvase